MFNSKLRHSQHKHWDSHLRLSWHRHNSVNSQFINASVYTDILIRISHEHF